MVKTLSELYLDARKTLTLREDEQTAGTYARQLVCHLTGISQAQFLANRDAVAGDDVYGPKKVITSLNGQCLHAGLIGFKHPRTNKYIEIESELPKYFTDFLRSIKK